MHQRLYLRGASLMPDTNGPTLPDTDSFTITSDIPCPYCGRMNGHAVERCWRCLRTIKRWTSKLSWLR